MITTSPTWKGKLSITWVITSRFRLPTQAQREPRDSAGFRPLGSRPPPPTPQPPAPPLLTGSQHYESPSHPMSMTTQDDPSSAPEQPWCADLYLLNHRVDKAFPLLAPATSATEVETTLVNKDDAAVIRGTTGWCKCLAGVVNSRPALAEWLLRHGLCAWGSLHPPAPPLLADRFVNCTNGCSAPPDLRAPP
jgi:hypothetical protein